MLLIEERFGKRRMKDTDHDDKQSVKVQRVKSYFIEAAKQIILSEGVENVSIRKVADRAGYTFTTIYNYFKDLNELLQETKSMMISDVMAHMQKDAPEEINEVNDVKKINRKYISYYFDRPNVFSFFYSYRLHPSQDTQTQALDFSDSYIKTYRSFAARGVIAEKEIPIIAKTIIYTLHGLLALYFSDNGMTKDMLYGELDTITGYLLGERP